MRGAPPWDQEVTYSMPLSRSTSPLRPVALVVWCVAWLVLVMLLLSPPEALPDEGTAIFPSDELAHVAAFAAITASAAVFCRTIGALAVVAALVFVGGGLLEWAQLFLPERTASFPDLVANAYGGVVGFLLGVLWILVRRRVVPRRAQTGPRARPL